MVSRGSRASAIVALAACAAAATSAQGPTEVAARVARLAAAPQVARLAAAHEVARFAAAPEVARLAAAPQARSLIAPNNTMPGRVSTCVRPLRRALRAFTFDGRRLAFDVHAGREPRCRDGKLRILRIAPLMVGGEAAYVRRGGCDYPERGSRCARQPTAHVRASDLEPVALEPDRRNGNGEAVAPCTRAARNDPAADDGRLERMFYKRPSDLPGRSVAGARWSNYGDQRRRFGGRSYSYLLWNLPRTAGGVLPGGGIVEAVLSQRQPLKLCDLPALTLPSFDAHGHANGLVRFAYAEVASGDEAIHGWVMRGYRHAGGPFRSTLKLAAQGSVA
jgi:hypothetical protein